MKIFSLGFIVTEIFQNFVMNEYLGIAVNTPKDTASWAAYYLWENELNLPQYTLLQMLKEIEENSETGNRDLLS